MKDSDKLTRIIRSRVDKIRAEFQDNSEERDNMDHKMNRYINDLLDALEQVEQDEYEMARPLFGRPSIRNFDRAGGSNDEDLLITNNNFVLWVRQPENDTVHVEIRPDGTSVDVRRLDSVETQPLTRHSQPAPKTISEGNPAEKEQVKDGNGDRSRIGGMMGKIKDGSQFISNAIKIWEFFQPVFLMGLSVLGGS